MAALADQQEGGCGEATAPQQAASAAAGHGAPAAATALQAGSPAGAAASSGQPARAVLSFMDTAAPGKNGLAPEWPVVQYPDMGGFGKNPANKNPTQPPGPTGGAPTGAPPSGDPGVSSPTSYEEPCAVALPDEVGPDTEPEEESD